MMEPTGASFVVVKHTYFDSGGTPDAELVRYLRGRAASVLDILHPFPDADSLPPVSTATLYASDGEVAFRRKSPPIAGPAVLWYVKDVLMTLWFVLTARKTFDLYIGADNLNAFAGLILRALGRVRRVAYYVIDFTPVRFKNPAMNLVYHMLNRFCCYHADVIWNVSDKMIEGRESAGISRERSAPQITVPLGAAFNRIDRKLLCDINHRAIVYFGSLRDEHGPGLIIEALPALLAQNEGFRIVFAGDGPLRKTLESRADELGIADHVTFTGFLDSDEAIYRTLTGCGVALATYPPSGDTYKMYADPGKVKIYLACGLPIVITNVPPVARTISEREAGVICDYTPENLAKAVLKLFASSPGYEHYRERAVELGREYDWNTIWGKTFESMPD